MVKFEIRDRIGVITIDRPEARNAVNGEVATGIESAIDELESSADLWVGIVASSGPVFSAGADLKAINTGRGGEMITSRGGFAGLVKRERTKPLIAAVDGPALAGGCEIVLSCDLVVAGAEAVFGIPEVKRCLVAGAGGLFRLPQRLPLNIAMELAVTGDPITAERAAQLGLVNRLVPAGHAVDAAVELAEQICANAPVAVRESRAVVLAAAGLPDDEAFALSEKAMGRAMQSADFAEGLNAFIEKRPPSWTGA